MRIFVLNFYNMRWFNLLLLVILVSSCALNKTFLHPWDLTTDDKVSAFVPAYHDTLTLSFRDDYSALITNSANEEAELSYTIETIFVENRTGDSLYAWLMEPKANFNGAMVYFLHGNAANLAYQILFAAPFVEAGYKVFIFDYSGFGFSQGEATRKRVKNDATDVFNYLLSREDIAFDHLLIYGQSLGGHLSVVIANEQ